jgi:hypothetical protein
MSTPVRRVAARVLVVGLGALLSGCSNGNPFVPTSSILVSGKAPIAGQTSQLDAQATLSNGTIRDVTTTATWASSNTDIATVTSGGLLKILAPGSAIITATYEGVIGSLYVAYGSS